MATTSTNGAGKVVLLGPPLTTILGQLQQVQAENIELRARNDHFNRIEADRLRFEKESRDAWNEVNSLKVINEKLRLDNERLVIVNKGLQLKMQELKAQVDCHSTKVDALNTEVEALKSEVEALKLDPLVIEVTQVLRALEKKVVYAIDDYSSYLSDVDLSPNSDAVMKSKKLYDLDRTDLVALKTIILAIREHRNNLAHPNVDPDNAEKWKAIIRDIRNSECLRVSDPSIDQIVRVAVQKCCGK